MNQDKFQLEHKGNRIDVTKHHIDGAVFFRIIFDNDSNARPLMLTRATHANAYKFWTSVPEGRQQEAEEFGALISEYFKSIA